jgi:hypothetical protein
MRLLLFTALSLLAVTYAAAHGKDDSLSRKTGVTPAEPVPQPNYCRNVVGICHPVTKRSENYIFDRSLYDLKVDTLPQVRFWRNIMNLHHDSALITFAATREVISKMSIRDWDLKSEADKKCYRDSVRASRGFDSTARILITTGKKFFYDFDRTSLNFDKGIHCFIDNNVDPWYAQAILLIESPNKLQKSNVGAYGPFQLMRDVARLYGLKVNRQVDERASFERSAYAASCLIKYICIPRAYQMLDSLRITNVTGDELWFKLLVMHVYHAGSYNVQKALFTFNPSKGDMDLIFTLWKTSAGKFKSASQNYSQLVLAAMLEMDERAKVKSRASFD